jgi:hypothetical protein
MPELRTVSLCQLSQDKEYDGMIHVRFNRVVGATNEGLPLPGGFLGTIFDRYDFIEDELSQVCAPPRTMGGLLIV